MKDIQQLIKKNGQEGRYEDIFPKTFIDAITDKESGTSLEDILAMFNMLFLSYNGSRSDTRLQVPTSLRRTGLWVTYVLFDKTVVTEWYASDLIDDPSWASEANWREGSNMLVGDISISTDGYWVINGVVTTIKAQGEQGITPILRVGPNNHLQVSYTNGSTYVDVSPNPVFTQFRVNNNKLEQSVDLGLTWTVASNYIAAWFRFTGTTGSSQADNVGKIQISRDNGATWSDLSGEFTNSLHIKGYVATVGALPSTAVQGDIYGVGPTYDPSDTEHTNPIYQLYVKNSTGWVNNGRFTSIAAGVVQEKGTSTTGVMSQAAVTRELAELEQSQEILNALQADVNSKLLLRIGSANSDGTPSFSTNRAINLGYICAPFNISLVSGYKFNVVWKYNLETNGNVTYAGYDYVDTNSLNITDQNYIYKLNIKKEDDSDITSLELNSIIQSFSGKISIEQQNIINLIDNFGIDQLSTKALIYSSVDSKCFIEKGSLHYTELEDSTTQARTIAYLSAPFSVKTSSGYKIRFIFRYQIINGIVSYVDYINGNISSYQTINDNYIYKILFEKSDSSEISDLELNSIIQEFQGRTISLDNDILGIKEDSRIEREDVDFSNYGIVNASNGEIEYATNPNYWNKLIDVSSIEIIDIPMFDSSTYGIAFLDANQNYISGQKVELAGRYRFFIPNKVKYLLYSYPSDSRADKDKVEHFDYIILYEQNYKDSPSLTTLNIKIKSLEKYIKPKKERPKNGAEAFSVVINGNYALLNTDQNIGDIYTPLVDYGNIWLPTNYSATGDPVPLAIICHGSGVTLDKYKNCELDDGKYLYDPAPYLVAKGYACMDMYAAPSNPQITDGLHLGNPLTLLCYKAGYDYVIKNYNVEQNAVFVSGSSMGGLSSFQIVQSQLFPVKAQAGFAPVIDLFKQAYCNPWRNSLDNSLRTRIWNYFHFEGATPTLTTQKPPTQDEIDYFYNNLDKIVGYNPISKIMVGGNYADTFKYIPSNIIIESDAIEKAIYDNFRAIHPCPIKIWHNLNDYTVCYRYSAYFIDMLRRAGQMAFLRPFTVGGHEAWNYGDDIIDTDIDGNVITTKVSQRECYLWFERFR